MRPVFAASLQLTYLVINQKLNVFWLPKNKLTIGVVKVSNFLTKDSLINLLSNILINSVGTIHNSATKLNMVEIGDCSVTDTTNQPSYWFTD